MQHLSLFTPKNELNDLQVVLVSVLGVGCYQGFGQYPNLGDSPVLEPPAGKVRDFRRSWWLPGGFWLGDDPATVGGATKNRMIGPPWGQGLGYNVNSQKSPLLG
jgi:hypothetical protein